jgi:hypothetical protein
MHPAFDRVDVVGVGVDDFVVAVGPLQRALDATTSSRSPLVEITGVSASLFSLSHSTNETMPPSYMYAFSRGPSSRSSRSVIADRG